MGMSAIFVKWPGPFITNFRSLILRSLHMKFEFNWPSGFRGEDVWKCWRTTDGRRTLLIAHLGAFGSGELNIGFPIITGLDLLKTTKLQSQHSMWAIIGLPAKRHFNSVSRFAGIPITVCSWWFLEPRSPRKNKTIFFIRIGHPLTKLSGSAHDVSYLVFGRFIQSLL